MQPYTSIIVNVRIKIIYQYSIIITSWTHVIKMLSIQNMVFKNIIFNSLQVGRIVNIIKQLVWASLSKAVVPGLQMNISCQ